MNAHWPEPDRRELVVAGAAGIIWALLGVTLLANGAESASCRITNHLPGGVANVGSGTLIDMSADRQRGLVLTCAHLFTEGTGRVIVAFPGKPTHGANLLAIDRNADLAALEILRPPIAPNPVALTIDSAAQLTACGFGPSGQFRAIAGPIVGASQSQGQTSLRIRGVVRSGDSGGGVFDPAGRLVAVVWGENGGETYASSGAPLRSFLERTSGRVASSTPALTQLPPATLAACPNGRCPLIGPSALYPSPSAPSVPSVRPFLGGSLFGNPASAPPASAPLQTPGTIAADGECNCGCDKDYAALVARLDALDGAKQDRGDYLPPTALNDYARIDQLTQLAAEGRTRHDALLERLGPLVATAGRAAAPFALSALGISGPAGWGILAAATVGSWWLGRRIKARGAGRDPRAGESPKVTSRASQPTSTPQEATAAADADFQRATSSHATTTHIETHAPIERDDREARELLRLSQLEGRDPLQDALAGRLALDRLDALAESDADPARARLADDLRRELRERFNEIAPTKFEVRLPSSS